MSPNYVKTLICLANSRKPSGSCVAGKEFKGGIPGIWIRPVSDRPSGELYLRERWYQNEQDPCVGDVLRLTLKTKATHAYQVENHIVDSGYYWAFDRKASWLEIRSCLDACNGPIWINNHSSRYGINDKVPLSDACNLGETLKLIKVNNLKVSVDYEWPEYGNKRKVRGIFFFNGMYYTLSITDPQIEAEYLRQQNGEYPIGEAILCISLSEPFKDYAYKLIAAVIRPM